MLRRVARLVLVIAILFSSVPLLTSTRIHAQDGSPIPLEPVSTAIPLPETPTDEPEIPPATEPVHPADFDGNTPPGSYLGNQIFPRQDVYFNVYEITVGGQTDVIDGTNGNGVFDAPGYRSDNAKVVTIVTTAQHSGDFKLCIIFDSNAFANPSTIAVLRLDGGSWTPLASVVDTTTACAYTPTFGVFAVAEAGGTSPTSLPSATSTATPTATATPSPAPSQTQPATHTATVTDTPTSAPNPIQFALPNVYVTFLPNTNRWHHIRTGAFQRARASPATRISRGQCVVLLGRQHREPIGKQEALRHVRVGHLRRSASTRPAAKQRFHLVRVAKSDPGQPGLRTGYPVRVFLELRRFRPGRIRPGHRDRHPGPLQNTLPNIHRHLHPHPAPNPYRLEHANRHIVCHSSGNRITNWRQLSHRIDDSIREHHALVDRHPHQHTGRNARTR